MTRWRDYHLPGVLTRRDELNMLQTWPRDRRVYLKRYDEDADIIHTGWAKTMPFSGILLVPISPHADRRELAYDSWDAVVDDGWVLD